MRKKVPHGRITVTTSPDTAGIKRIEQEVTVFGVAIVRSSACASRTVFSVGKTVFPARKVTRPLLVAIAAAVDAVAGAADPERLEIFRAANRGDLAKVKQLTAEDKTIAMVCSLDFTKCCYCVVTCSLRPLMIPLLVAPLLCMPVLKDISDV